MLTAEEKKKRISHFTLLIGQTQRTCNNIYGKQVLPRTTSTTLHVGFMLPMCLGCAGFTFTSPPNSNAEKKNENNSQAVIIMEKLHLKSTHKRLHLL